MVRYDVIALDGRPADRVVIQRQPTDGDKTAVARGELLRAGRGRPHVRAARRLAHSRTRKRAPVRGSRSRPSCWTAPLWTTRRAGTGVLSERRRPRGPCQGPTRWSASGRGWRGKRRRVVRLSYGRATPEGTGAGGRPGVGA
ncbi:hypothetical protein QJS66_22310 [Kocuria rhizophila]|nr:hypothetical protein QJS66_22310 [Kocuria rhizophila]